MLDGILYYIDELRNGCLRARMTATRSVPVRVFGRVRQIAKREFGFVMSGRLSARNNSASSGRIFMKFYILVFLKHLLRKFKFR